MKTWILTQFRGVRVSRLAWFCCRILSLPLMVVAFSSGAIGAESSSAREQATTVQALQSAGEEGPRSDQGKSDSSYKWVWELFSDGLSATKPVFDSGHLGDAVDAGKELLYPDSTSPSPTREIIGVAASHALSTIIPFISDDAAQGAGQALAQSAPGLAGVAGKASLGDAFGPVVDPAEGVVSGVKIWARLWGDNQTAENIDKTDLVSIFGKTVGGSVNTLIAYSDTLVSGDTYWVEQSYAASQAGQNGPILAVATNPAAGVDAAKAAWIGLTNPDGPLIPGPASTTQQDFQSPIQASDQDRAWLDAFRAANGTSSPNDPSATTGSLANATNALANSGASPSESGANNGPVQIVGPDDTSAGPSSNPSAPVVSGGSPDTYNPIGASDPHTASSYPNMDESPSQPNVAVIPQSPTVIPTNFLSPFGSLFSPWQQFATQPTTRPIRNAPNAVASQRCSDATQSVQSDEISLNDGWQTLNYDCGYECNSMGCKAKTSDPILGNAFRQSIANDRRLVTQFQQQFNNDLAQQRQSCPASQGIALPVGLMQQPSCLANNPFQGASTPSHASARPNYTAPSSKSAPTASSLERLTANHASSVINALAASSAGSSAKANHALLVGSVPVGTSKDPRSTRVSLPGRFSGIAPVRTFTPGGGGNLSSLVNSFASTDWNPPGMRGEGPVLRYAGAWMIRYNNEAIRYVTPPTTRLPVRAMRRRR